MRLNIQKRLAGQVLKCSSKKVKLDLSRLDDIKEAITKADIRGLIKDNAIIKKPSNTTSRARIRKNLIQKRKGRQRGVGSRKGTSNARLERKRVWINKIRLQRKLLTTLVSKELITIPIYRMLYNKARGGFFRNKRHIKIYLDDNNLVNKKLK